MNTKSSFLFLPTTENHFLNFLPLIEPLISEGIDAKIIIVNQAIPANRAFSLNFVFNNNYIKCNLSEIESLIEKEQNAKSFLIVGNDSEPVISKIIRLFKKKNDKNKVVLFQDGWLESKNINNPIYIKTNIFTFFKRHIHRFLTKKWMPTKKYFHNFIGQNSDYFFVYSEIAKKNFIKAGLNVENIFITGSPRHKQLRLAKFNILNPRVIVLFSTVTETENDFKIVKECITNIKNFYSDYKLIIKLHPSENQSKYKEIISKDMILTKSSIKEVVENYNIEMSFCFASTVVFDMLVLGIPIIQLAPNDINDNFINYYKNLPILNRFEDLRNTIENFDLIKARKIGKEYLIDIDPTLNSINISVNVIKNLIK